MVLFFYLLMIVGFCFHSSQLISLMRFLHACVYFGPSLYTEELFLHQLPLLYPGRQSGTEWGKEGIWFMVLQDLMSPLLLLRIYTALIRWTEEGWLALSTASLHFQALPSQFQPRQASSSTWWAWFTVCHGYCRLRCPFLLLSFPDAQHTHSQACVVCRRFI